MKNKYCLPLYLSLFLSSGVLLGGCKGDDTLDPMVYVGAEKLTRLVVSPNSPLLVADGESRLTLDVEGFYEYEGKEYPMPQDRLPLDQITISVSDGSTIKAGDTFIASGAEASEISFVASMSSGLKSQPVSVKLEDPDEISNDFEQIAIPVVFAIYYTEAEEQGLVSGLTDEHIDRVLERINQVFNGGKEALPSSGNIHVTFEKKYIRRYLLSEADAKEMKTKPTEVMERLILDGEEAMDAANTLNIWVIPNSLNQNVSDLTPRYTLGDPGDIEFPNPLTKVDSHAGVKEAIQAEDPYSDDARMSVPQIGITIPYGDMAQALSGSGSGMRIEKLIGAFYGLLTPDDARIKNSDSGDWMDTDYCADTYTYIKPVSTSVSVKKATYPNPSFNGGTSFTFNSYNVMDDHSSTYGITKRQAARMRQVMRDVPYRKQGTGGDTSEQEYPFDPFYPFG